MSKNTLGAARRHSECRRSQSPPLAGQPLFLGRQRRGTLDAGHRLRDRSALPGTVAVTVAPVVISERGIALESPGPCAIATPSAAALTAALAPINSKKLDLSYVHVPSFLYHEHLNPLTRSVAASVSIPTFGDKIENRRDPRGLLRYPMQLEWRECCTLGR